MRSRNARGEGSHLAEEIVEGALALIEAAGSDDVVTLRSVARSVGIAAPSIYAHFRDREAILWGVAVRVFDEIAGSVEAAVAGVDDPVGRLLAGCDAYVGYALAHPGVYRVLFARQFHRDQLGEGPVGQEPAATLGTPTLLLDDRFPAVGADSFALLVHGIERCVAAGVSSSTDPTLDAMAVWVALHGVVSLRTAVPGFPWPPAPDLVRRVVLPLAGIGTEGARPARG